MAILTRADKGSPLTHTEMDSNFLDASENIRVEVRNVSGSTLTAGTIVKATGFNNGENKTEIEAVSATDDVAFAVLDADLSNNSNGTAVNTGVVKDVIPTGLFNEGTKLYSDGSGGFTHNQPDLPFQTVGYCLRQHSTEGIVFVQFSEQQQHINFAEQERLEFEEDGFAKLKLWVYDQNSYIRSSSNEGLTISTLQNSGTIKLEKEDGVDTETMIEATPNGAVDIYYDGSKKLETTTDGIDITGDLIVYGEVQSYSAVIDTMTFDSYGISFDAGSNYLGDYEEGTFTPEYDSNSGYFSTASYSEQGGRYVRVGNVVHIQLRLRTNNLVQGTASQFLKIIGLPFTCASSSVTGRNAISMANVYTWGTKQPMNGFVESNQTYIVLQYRDAIDGNDNTFDSSQMSFGTGLRNSIFISATYMVD